VLSAVVVVPWALAHRAAPRCCPPLLQVPQKHRIVRITTDSLPDEAHLYAEVDTLDVVLEGLGRLTKTGMRTLSVVVLPPGELQSVACSKVVRLSETVYRQLFKKDPTEPSGWRFVGAMEHPVVTAADRPTHITVEEWAFITAMVEQRDTDVEVADKVCAYCSRSPRCFCPWYSCSCLHSQQPAQDPQEMLNLGMLITLGDDTWRVGGVVQDAQTHTEVAGAMGLLPDTVRDDVHKVILAQPTTDDDVEVCASCSCSLRWCGGDDSCSRSPNSRRSCCR
jgi:hypothetical protein